MPREVVEDVFDITCRESGVKRYRVYLSTSGVPTLVDAGPQGTTDAVVDALTEIGVQPERLVLTHGDPDHVGGFDRLADRYDLETWVPEQTTRELKRIDHRYGDGDRIGQFEAVHVPGHTEDNHVLVGDGVCIVGDALWGADRRGLPAGEFHLPPAVYSEDLNRAEESLERLLPYEFDVALVFHGTSITERADDRLDQYVDFAGKPE